jgi:S1-C subfamily serine protease
MAAGDRVALEILRDGEPRTVRLELGKRPTDSG